MANANVSVVPVKKKYEGAIRTGIYCRVSSTKKHQIESLAVQISALTNFISYLPGHVLVDTYIDIASGNTLEGRPGFRRMVQDCQDGKLQLIMTKSISRFGRDILVALAALRELTIHGVNVHFEEEGLDSTTPDLQVHLAAHLAVAQQDNISRSENINWGLRVGAEEGSTKNYNRVCYGFKHDKHGNLVIKEDEAKNVRLIFRLYLDGHSILSIIDELSHLHIQSPTGKDKWNKRYIEKMLSNVKYSGDSSVFIKDDEYRYTDHHPAIISKASFEAAQAQRNMRSNQIENPDGSISRKNTRYNGKKTVRETVDIESWLSDRDLL